MADLDRLEKIADYFQVKGLKTQARCVREAIEEIRASREAEKCPKCHGDGTMFYALRGMDRCETCGGSGRRD